MKITITTPLYYVNDKPHLGSTYTTLACDTYARFNRLEGNEVVFITGVDEHGQKIQRTAESKSMNPIDHCNQVSSTYKELWTHWDISYNRFIRTTSTRHKELVENFFSRVIQSGDIKLGKQTGWYCVGCEEFKEASDDKDLKVCPIHQKPLEWRDEENLFFCLSKYQDQIEKLIDGEFIYPLSRRNEIKSFVAQGLKDFSISRLNVKWGIPVPGYSGHTFYVWFDALLGYLSALLDDGKEIDLQRLNDYLWPQCIHVIGKDILRFHAVYWPAMLLSAGLKPPRKLFGHGFLTREGQKMGKSLGNVLDPKDLLDQYGAELIRWYLLSDIKFGQDGDFQIKRFIDLVNNDLANTIGNLLNRTTSMSRKWFDNSVPILNNLQIEGSPLEKLVNSTVKKTRKAYRELDFKEACNLIMNLASNANLYLNETQPWTLIKDPDKVEKVSTDIYLVLETTRIVGLLLMPIIPLTAKSILTQLGYTLSVENWEAHLKFGLLPFGQTLPLPVPLVTKLEKD